MLAAIGAHLESQELKTMTPQFKGALEKLFGEKWKERATETKEWGALMDATTKRKAVTA